ncbi:replication factor-A protein [Sodiomyces alkalinus F11]|uniref:Replication protein A subunit n=1 Tax=Sodiomyces alkalinus (strain CBS 110278 / VKM F-3762 / F11) TaxID=1314773 RepID=A0A3N2PT74_SODAK|nr:replication factor-A protein [Sodiomyces alkalinus F11]ROT37719.1 replication factor-A protein [Sodiomyces alkalinus F11]
MDPASRISRGALNAIFTDPDNVATKFPVPILQCLQIKPLGGQPGSVDRYRIVLSDVNNYVQSMLATQVNHLVHDGQLVRNCIVRITNYQPNTVKGKNILIILGLEVISELGQPDKIGDPVAFEPSSESAPNTTTIGGQNFYGAKKEEKETKPRMSNIPSRPTTTGGGHGSNNIYPIEALSPYAHKWTIKARVTQKGDIRTWHKPSGEGKLFSVNLLDESGEIKATGFNEQCDQYYDMLQEGSVYYISSPCKVSIAKKQFSNLPNDYELVLERDTVIEKAEDQSSVPQVRFNFCTIQELQSVEKDATVDVVGVLKEVGEVSQITSKTTQRPYEKRELTIVDDTNFSVRVTIWGKSAQNFDARPESVIAFKGLRVSDFGGRSLSLLSSGTMTVDPDIADAHRLKGWYDSSGRNDSFATHSGMAPALGAATGRGNEDKFVVQVKDEQLGMNEGQDFFNLKATIVYIKPDTFAYPACRKEGCNKRVIDVGDGTWRCEKCDINHSQPTYRYIMSVNVCDHTSQLWLSCFDEVGRAIMGVSADELMELKESGDEAAKAAVFEQASCKKLFFRCSAKMDTFGETQRIRYQARSAAPLDYKTEGHKLVELIKQYTISS